MTEAASPERANRSKVHQLDEGWGQGNRSPFSQNGKKRSRGTT